MSIMSKDFEKDLMEQYSDKDPICATTLFQKLKREIGEMQFNLLKMRTANMTAIEANPATHAITKYVYNLLQSPPLSPITEGEQGSVIELLRELVMRAQIFFPENEHDLKWFEEEFRGQNDLFLKLSNLLGLGVETNNNKKHK